MATEFDLMLFDQHLEAALESPAAKRWNLERDPSVPLGVLCVMHPRTVPTELFKARLRWTDYSKPPSLKFISIETGSETDAQAWPNIEGSRATSFFLCAPWTQEGNSHHPEWATSPAARYPNPEDPVEFALTQLQHLFDNTYQGRGTP
jgi:hypothetical protein